MSDKSDKTEHKTSKKPSEHVDAGSVRTLAELCQENDLSEIEYKTSDFRIRVTRTPTSPPQQHFVASAPQPASSAPGQPVAGGQSAAQDAPQPVTSGGVQDYDGHPGAVRSPMVGTVYLAPQPGADPFVQVGQDVKEGETLLIVEAMKVMNPIKAPKDGKVEKVFVQDATPVEYDDLLMILA